MTGSVNLILIDVCGKLLWSKEADKSFEAGYVISALFEVGEIEEFYDKLENETSSVIRVDKFNPSQFFFDFPLFFPIL